MNNQTIRFGYTDSIHLLPLLHPLLAGWVYPSGFRLELEPMLPHELNDAVAGGALQGALLDPVHFAKLRAVVEPLPGIGLASEGGNAAAVLISAARADELEGAAIRVEPGAAGAMGETMIRVLQEPYFGINARIDRAAGQATSGTPAPSGEDAAPEPQARVVAGDEAARARAPWLRYEAQFNPAEEERAARKKNPAAPLPAPDPAEAGYAADLGAAWWVLTGTPLVWSVAAIRQDLLTQERLVVELVRAFRESRRSAQEQLDTIVDTASRRVGVDEAVIRAIFAAQRLEVGGREHAGLNILYDHTRRLRLT